MGGWKAMEFRGVRRQAPPYVVESMVINFGQNTWYCSPTGCVSMTAPCHHDENKQHRGPHNIHYPQAWRETLPLVRHLHVIVSDLSLEDHCFDWLICSIGLQINTLTHCHPSHMDGTGSTEYTFVVKDTGDPVRCGERCRMNWQIHRQDAVRTIVPYTINYGHNPPYAPSAVNVDLSDLYGSTIGIVHPHTPNAPGEMNTSTDLREWAPDWAEVPENQSVQREFRIMANHPEIIQTAQQILYRFVAPTKPSPPRS